MTEFELRVSGVRYSGWTELRLTRSMEQLAHSFSVGLTDQWNEDAEPIPVEAGDECVVLVNGLPVTTGYVDDDSLSYDAKNRVIGFSGRSKTCDLVDCSAIYKTGQWKKAKLLRIATDLCAPFGITVSTNVNLGKAFTNPGYSIQEGETGFDCLARAARARGVLMFTDGDGNLVFDRVGSEIINTVLKRGVNIVRGSKKNSWKDRFSQYIIKAQSAGNDDAFGRTSAALKRTADDDGVTRYRPMIVLADTEDSGTELQKRANWERNVRAGKAKELEYTVLDWEHDDGLWEPNKLVRVFDPDARVDDKLLISSVTYSRSNSGTTTSLSVTIPQAYSIEPLPPPKASKGSLL